MLTARQRPLVFAAVALVVVWGVAWGGFRLARSSRMTPEKLRAYLESVELSRLQGDARTRAIAELAKRLNALSLEERRKARIDGMWERWFEQMTDDEKSSFVEQTLPTGVQQMLGAFEQLPEDRRKRTVDEAIKRLQEARAAGGPPGGGEGEGRFAISEELRQKATTIGLKTYFSQSSAQTKAELAPLLEEMQNVMKGMGSSPRHGPHR